MVNELSIVAPRVTTRPQPIEIENQEQIEASVKALVAKYSQDFVVTSDNIKDTKKMRTQLNNVSKAINNKRLETDRSYKKPMVEFDKLMNGYKKQILEIMEPLDAKISEVEELERQKRLEAVTHTIEEMAPNFGVSPADITVRPEWGNKSISTKQIVSEISDDMRQLKKNRDQRATDVQTIRMYADSMELDSSGWVALLSQGVTVTEILEQMNRAVERRDQEAKEAAERDERRKESAQAVAATHQVERDGETVDTETGEVVLQSVSLKLTGTNAQLQKLRENIDRLGVIYKVIHE